jgi:hypothetical protein
MPNWCFTNYVLEGEKDEIQDLYDKLMSLEKMEKPLAESDFGKNWLGCVVTLFGGDWEKVECRGDFSCLEKTSDTTISFNTETAWGDMPEVWKLVLSHYKSIKCYFCAEESGNCYYATNDVDGVHFPTRFIVEQWEEDTEYHDDESDLFSDIASRTSEIVTNREEMDKAIEQYNEANPDNEIFVNEYNVTTF